MSKYPPASQRRARDHAVSPLDCPECDPSRQGAADGPAREVKEQGRLRTAGDGWLTEPLPAEGRAECPA
ncbi:MAG: hypothetical protein ACYTGH_08965 [Planctomycetota bacterium]